MATPAAKAITKMGVREYTKKAMKNGKEIARVGISCTFQHILIATLPPHSFKEQAWLPKGYSFFENQSSLKTKVLWLSAPQNAALFTFPKWCIKICHSVMEVLDSATTHMSVETNMLGGSQMWHVTQKIQ